MTKATIYLLENNEWVERTKEFCHPIEQTRTLDETLDGGFLRGMPTEKMELYPRFTPIKIIAQDVDENGSVTYEDTEYYVANDQSDMFRAIDPRLYEHTFILTEPTRLLERYFISGMSVTQPFPGEGNRPSKSVADVVDYLLRTAQCLRTGEAARFILDSCLRDKLSRINSCEFKWSCRMTLKECLKEIGKLIGAEPRLIPEKSDDRVYNTVTFDFYNRQGKDISDLRYTAYKEDCLENQHHSSVETYAENMIAQADENQASVTYPSKNGWVTPRTTDDIKLTDGNCEIFLPEKIYKILKVYVTGVRGKAFASFGPRVEGTFSNEFDLTAYVKEKQVWNLLKTEPMSSSREQFLKNNTFYYSENSNAIILSNESYPHTVTEKLTVFQELMNTIENTVFRKGLDVMHFVPDNPNNKPFDVDFGKGGGVEGGSYGYYNDLRNLKFRVEYIPLAPSRICAMNSGSDVESTMAYNQQAEYNDCRAIGRNMKNVVERLGAKEKQVVIQHRTFAETPHVGDIFDGYTVNKVTRKFKSRNNLETMFTASENESRLSEKISVNQKFRQWAIPADDIEKHLLRNEYCFIEEEKRINTSSAKTAFMKRFANVFEKNKYDSITEVDCAIVCGCDVSGNTDGYEKVLASVQSSAIADSLKFTFRMKDNYSAGLKKDGDEIIDVPYAGSRGEAPAFRIAWGSELASGYDANSLPLCPNGLALSYLDGTFVTYKDASERLAMTYQMHVLSKLKNVIVGCKLTENNPLVREWEKEKAFRFWKLTKPLSRFALLLTDEGEEVLGMSMTATVLSGSIQLHISGIDTSGVGWAITDENGYLYIAENAMNESVRDLYFNFSSERR